jgi:2-dehydro-3-deoxygluconokinase
VTDLVTFGEGLLRLSPPDDERLETAREFDVRVGGAEANVAVAAQRLGAETAWLSKVHDGPLGHRLVNEFRGYGVAPEVVWSDEGRQGVYYLEHAGEPRGTTVHYDREGAAVTTAEAEELATDRIEDARAFFTTGITLALSTTTAETTANLLSVARQAGTKTVFDMNYRSKLWEPDRARAMLTKLFPAIDVLVAAARDAREVLDLEGEPQRIAHQLASTWDFDTVVITRGERGSLALQNGVVHEKAAFDTETADPVGTGDAFAGAFVARRLAGDEVQAALEFANAAAAVKRTIPGDVATFTPEEVRTVIERADDRDIAR